MLNVTTHDKLCDVIIEIELWNKHQAPGPIIVQG